MSIPIQRKWYDVVAYATAPINKKKHFSLTYPELLILEKLIHYDTNNRYITYSNRIIANHTFRKERDVENIILSLKKKGFIASQTQTIVNGHNDIAKKRTITINWGLFDSILAEIESAKEQPAKASQTHKDIPTPPVTEDSHQLVEQPVKPMDTDRQVIEPAHSEDRPQLSTSQKNLIHKVIDIVLELLKGYNYLDEIFMHKLIDDYEILIRQSILSYENFNEAKVRNDIAKQIFQEQKNLKVAS